MNYYFKVLLTRLYRKSKEGKVPILIGVSLLTLLFLSFSVVFISNLPDGDLYYPFIVILCLIPLSNKKRNNYLIQLFGQRKKMQIRLVENILIGLPFILFCLFNLMFIQIPIVLILSALISFYTIKHNFSFSFPTPFYRHPFEFIVGFRKYFWVVFIGIILLIIGIQVNNSNLALMTLFIPFILAIQFYSNSEPVLYVWVNSCTPKLFLRKKIFISLMYGFLLSVPTFIPLLIIWPEHYLIILAIEMVGLIYIIASLLGKYAFFPSELNVIQGFMLVIGIIFPPFMLIIIPAFYKKAIINLEPILT